MGDLSEGKKDVYHDLKGMFEKSTIPDSITFEEALKEEGVHVVHTCIYAKTDKCVTGLESHSTNAAFKLRSIVLMHLRHDGHLGFAGGVVDESLKDLPLHEAQHKAVEALKRELEEELNFDTKKHIITVDNYLFSTRNVNLVISSKAIFLHFYAVEVPEEDVLEIEKRSLETYEHGREVFGNIRVPLYTMSDGYRGFPAFIKNQFIGTSRLQLFYFLLHFGIMSKDEILVADRTCSSKPLFQSNVSNGFR